MIGLSCGGLPTQEQVRLVNGGLDILTPRQGDVLLRQRGHGRRLHLIQLRSISRDGLSEPTDIAVAPDF
jgi:hypothetical protein